MNAPYCRCPGCGQCEAAAALDARSHQAGLYARRMQQAQEARKAAIAERNALRKAVEALRDECLEEAALDAKGREWCAARINQVLRGVL